MENKSKISLLLGLGILLVVFFAIWQISIPGGLHAPDEHAHFGMMNFIASTGRLPIAGETLLKQSIGDYSWYYGALPPAPYIVGAIGIFVGKLLQANNTELLYFARVMSSLSGIGVAILAYFTLVLLFPKKKGIAFVLPVLILTNPQSSFIYSYANNDAFTSFATTFVFYLLVRGYKTGWTKKLAIVLGIALGVCMLSKYNAYPIIFIAMLLYFLQFRRNYKVGWKYFSVTLIMGALISGWWFIRNALLYHGDFLGLKTSKLTSTVGYFGQRWSLIAFLNNTPFLEDTFRSSWGVFDYMSIWLSSNYYLIVASILAFSFIGFLYAAKTKKNGGLDEEESYNIVLTMTLMIIITGALAIWNSYTNDFQPQGKYLFVSILPSYLMIVLGLEKIINRNPLKIRKYIWLGIVILSLSANGYALYTINNTYNPRLISDNALLDFSQSQVISKDGGWVEKVSEPESIYNTTKIAMRGWAIDPEKMISAKEVLIVCDNKPIPYLIPIKSGINSQRPDVANALRNSNLENSGWSVYLDSQFLGVGHHTLKFYSVLENNRYSALAHNGPILVDVP